MKTKSRNTRATRATKQTAKSSADQHKPAAKKRPKKRAKTAAESGMNLGTPSDEENLEFLKAIDLFKRRTGKNFPTWTEVLQILQGLGYAKQ